MHREVAVVRAYRLRPERGLVVAVEHHGRRFVALAEFRDEVVERRIRVLQAPPVSFGLLLELSAHTIDR